jgi:hypothetical protein
MKFLVSVLLGILPLSAADRDILRAPIRLFARFDHEPRAAVRQAIEDELDAIMLPTGWRFTWSSSADDQVSIERVSVHFRGKCDAAALPLFFAERPRSLGTTYVNGGRVYPFSRVDCDGILASMAPALASLEPSERDLVYGRAAGRVLAHELYHVLADTQQHAPTGVAQGFFSLEDLLAYSLHFHKDQASKLRTKLAALLEPEWVAVATPEGAFSIYITSGCSACHGLRGEGTGWGPSLGRAAGRYDAEGLITLLGSTRSAMYRRAKSLRVLWPRLSVNDVEILVAFLNGLTE